MPRMALPLGKSTSPLPQKTVLIIHDDPLFQEELTGALVCAGIQVENAYDGEAGFRSIIKEAPDLVILDLILPKSSTLRSASHGRIATVHPSSDTWNLGASEFILVAEFPSLDVK